MVWQQLEMKFGEGAMAVQFWSKNDAFYGVAEMTKMPFDKCSHWNKFSLRSLGQLPCRFALVFRPLLSALLSVLSLHID